MLLAALLRGSGVFEVHPPRLRLLLAGSILRNILAHFVERMRDAIGRLLYFGALHQLFNPQQRAMPAVRDDVPERDRLADEMQISAARAAETLLGGRFRSAFWTIHKGF